MWQPFIESGFHLLGGAGGKLPPKPSIFPPKVIHEKYLVIHEKYLVTSSHSCYIVSFRVFFTLQHSVCTLFLAAIS